jgi:hypothetical protein
MGTERRQPADDCGPVADWAHGPHARQAHPASSAYQQHEQLLAGWGATSAQPPDDHAVASSFGRIVARSGVIPASKRT